MILPASAPRAKLTAMSFSETNNLSAASLAHPDQFVRRHIGPDSKETSEMLALLGRKSLDELIDAACQKKFASAKN